VTISPRNTVLVVCGLAVLFLICLLLGQMGMPIFLFLDGVLLILLVLGLIQVADVPFPAATAEASPSPFIYRPGPERARLLFFAGIIFELAALIQWRLYAPPPAADVEVVAATAGVESAQRLASAGIAFLVAAVSVGFVIAVAAVLVMNLDYWGLSDAPNGPPVGAAARRWRAFIRCLHIVLGLSRGTVVLEKGKLYRPDGQEVDVCVGPCYLDVRDNQVAAIETGGHVGDAVGRGRYWLAGNQRVTGYFSLGLQVISVVIEKVVTRDGMIIDRLELEVIYRMGNGDREQPAGGPLQFDSHIVTNDLARATIESYKQNVDRVAQSQARAVIGNYDLREIMMLPADARKAMSDQIKDGIAPILRESRFRAVNIGKIELSPDAVRELTDRWVAAMQAETATIRARTQKETTILKGEGHALAFYEVEKIKKNVREELIRQLSMFVFGDTSGTLPVTDDLAKRYLDAVEALTGYLAQDSGQALQMIETLETMARHSKQLNLYIGSDELWQHRRTENDRPQPPSPPIGS